MAVTGPDGVLHVPVVEVLVPMCSGQLLDLHCLDALVLDLDAALHSKLNLNLMLILTCWSVL
jgi:hypothetical protein